MNEEMEQARTAYVNLALYFLRAADRLTPGMVAEIKDGSARESINDTIDRELWPIVGSQSEPTQEEKEP